MEKKGLSDYVALAKLSIKNSLMETGSLVLFLGIFVGLIVMAASFFCYGLAVLLEGRLGYPGAGYLAVGAIGLLGLVGAYKWAQHRRCMQVLRLKAAIADSQHELLDTTALETLVQQYPWGATGLAVGLGFVASSQVYLADWLVPLGKAVAPLVAEVLAAQKESQSEEDASC